MEIIEKMQKDILTSLFHLPISTPYWGVLEESGSWPMVSRIFYRKLMLFYNLIKSNEKRMAKKILIDQIEQQRNNCWYSELKEQIEKYKIFDEIEQITCYKKSKWKKLVKDKIQQYVNKEYQRESNSMKKLRFVNEKQVK